ncbi:macro domain-containing protein [Nocardia sp. NPDC057663]|uniref:macro domain-containing protein n=1 Tax=Nocardia sp. NPDC057663 TaxID=3346201 RepID=UPI00366F008C
MGKGIALRFKQTYPEMFREYAKAARAGDLQIGRMFVWQTGATTGPRLVINYPTKRHWRSASRFIERTTYGCTIGVAFRCAQVST